MLLSIIIPIYNVEKYLRICLDSISKQKSNNIEFICIDDGSTDSSKVICEEYARKDKRFKIFHKENGGVSSARNWGLRKAKGKYIAWIDPDDYVSSDWYSSIETLLNDDIDIIFFDYFILKNNRKILNKYGKHSQQISVDLFLKEIVLDQKIENQLWQKIFKRTLFENIIFPENVKSMEDYAVLHKIVLKSNNIYYLSKPLYFYRIRSDSLVTQCTLDKNYMSYLIAKNRYNYLLRKNKKVSKLGYLVQSLNVCIQYNKIKKEEQIKNREIYNKCKIEINKNIWYIFSSNECSLSIKFKFLLYKIGLLRLALYMKKIIENNN